MNIFTPEEIQDLEDAIYLACLRVSWKQEFLSKDRQKRQNLFVERLLKLKTKLAEPIQHGKN